MSSNRPRPSSRERRARRNIWEFWKRAFIWVFILVFAFSVAGAMVVFTAVK